MNNPGILSFASGAALMLTLWETSADRPIQAFVSALVCLFFGWRVWRLQ